MVWRSVFGIGRRQELFAHLLAVQTSVVGLEDNELLAGDVETGALDLLDVGGVLECGDDFGHLCGRNLWRRTRSAQVLSLSYRLLLFPHLFSHFSHKTEGMVKRTVKPAEVAQTLLPSLLKMAALSMLPVPIRLRR